MATFARDIRPLFRERDVEEMRYAFDLGAYEDVKANAEEIHRRVADGSMPCDVAWPDDRVALLRRWIDEGAPAWAHPARRVHTMFMRVHGHVPVARRQSRDGSSRTRSPRSRRCSPGSWSPSTGGPRRPSP